LLSAWKNGLAEISHKATTVTAVRKEIEEKRNGTLIAVKIFCETHRDSKVENTQSKEKILDKK